MIMIKVLTVWVSVKILIRFVLNLRLGLEVLNETAEVVYTLKDLHRMTTTSAEFTLY